jgi:site-specific DNA-methyltransferase (adenine-specific)
VTDSYQLYCLDCIKGAQKYIADNSVDLIITDPPYGIKANNLDRHYHRQEENIIEGYIEVPREKYGSFSKGWIKEAERILKPGGSLYIISGYSNLADILNALRETNLEEKNHIIWKYNFGVHTQKKYISSHYHILYYTKPGGKHIFNTYSRFGPDEKDNENGSLNYQDREDVWFINREYKPGEIKNKNELPKKLITKIMQYSSNEGDLICDFFLGGFNTAKVAIGLKRRIIGFELNQKSFTYHLKEISVLKQGYLLSSLREGLGSSPVNQRKRWSQSEKVNLKKRFSEIYKKTRHKRETIRKLENEFGRGYFSILNQIEKMNFPKKIKKK